MAKTSSVVIPEIKDILTTGLQFGHNASRWNPKMSKFIFGAKNGIHIIDVVQTRQLLSNAADFLQKAAKEAPVLFVGSKRQAAAMVESEAQRAGAYFISDRWPGGLLTNLAKVRQSLYKLQDLEKQFNEGVAGRTKYEVAQMKVQWTRKNRLYRGVKEMDKLPSALVVIDPRYEKVAVREARALNIPVIALADTNCDPDKIDYLIPGNDDALRSIEMVLRVLADAVLVGNEGKGVKHNLRDYNQAEVELKKAVSTIEEGNEPTIPTPGVETKMLRVSAKPSKVSKPSGKGILERVKEEAAKSAKK